MKVVKKKKCKSISFIGFKGGYLKKNCDLSLHFPIENYGISEDCNHIMMHLVLYYLKQKHLNIKALKKSIF